MPYDSSEMLGEALLWLGVTGSVVFLPLTAELQRDTLADLQQIDAILQQAQAEGELRIEIWPGEEVRLTALNEAIARRQPDVGIDVSRISVSRHTILEFDGGSCPARVQSAIGRTLTGKPTVLDWAVVDYLGRGRFRVRVNLHRHTRLASLELESIRDVAFTARYDEVEGVRLDWSGSGVNWRSDVREARREAASQRKPLLIFRTEGNCEQSLAVRAGPLSDPIAVTLINRYFVPVQIEAEEPDARGTPAAVSMVLEAPGPDGVPTDTRALEPSVDLVDVSRFQGVLQEFLGGHPDFRQPWPELQQLEGARDVASRIRRVDLLLQEGQVEPALAVLGGNDLGPVAALLRARALRMGGQRSQAQRVLSALTDGPAPALETILLLYDRGQHERAASLLGQFLARYPDAPEAAEAFFLRGWLLHLDGREEEAARTWREGIERHPPAGSLFSQKAFFALLRGN